MFGSPSNWDFQFPEKKEKSRISNIPEGVELPEEYRCCLSYSIPKLCFLFKNENHF